MAPEQVRGEPADHRTDIFAFGLVLYEMLSGRTAFRGERARDDDAILTRTPRCSSSRLGPIPPGLDRLVEHCLEKAPDERFQSTHDVAYDLQSISTISSVDGGRPTARPRAGGARMVRLRALGARAPRGSRRVGDGSRARGPRRLPAVLPPGLVSPGPDCPARASRPPGLDVALRRNLAGRAVAALRLDDQRPKGTPARAGRRAAHGPLLRGRARAGAPEQSRPHVAMGGHARALGSRRRSLV